MLINQQTFAALNRCKPLRIDFTNALKPSPPPYCAALNFSFSETIQKLFESETGLSLFKNPNRAPTPADTSVWRSVQNAHEYQQIQSWIQQQGETVFIRSLLSLCMALSLNVNYDKKQKTALGQLEHAAKYHKNSAAIAQLADSICEKIHHTHFYKNAPYICAVPATKNKPFDLPAHLAARIAAKLNLKNLTAGFSYGAAKRPLKEISLKAKWRALESSKLTFDPTYDKINTCKPLILFDDKYQSGATMHYVASVLHAGGFKAIYGLTIVKTLKNDDNHP